MAAIPTKWVWGNLQFWFCNHRFNEPADRLEELFELLCENTTEKNMKQRCFIDFYPTVTLLEDSNGKATSFKSHTQVSRR